MTQENVTTTFNLKGVCVCVSSILQNIHHASILYAYNIPQDANGYHRGRNKETWELACTFFNER